MIKKHLYPILLSIILTIIFVANIKPETYLLGWDNFNSEFHPTLAISQALTSAWSDFRSFGLPAGMGYATDLWHAIFVWISSLILPPTIIRYLFHLVMFAVGGIGVLSLFRHLGFSKPNSFVGGLFYTLNFGTTQIFGLPYEPFSIFFAFLPWAILTFLKLTSLPNRRNFLTFSLINLLISGSFYVQTMFLVYAIIFTCLTIHHLLNRPKPNFAVYLKAAILVILLNSYWLFNQVYFIGSKAIDTVRTADQTQLGWDIPFYQTKAHSTIFDFFSQKNLYIDFLSSSGTSYFETWLNHLSSPPVLLLQIIIIFFVIIGIVDGRHQYKRFFIILLILHAIALLPSLPIISNINQIMRQSSFIDQIFRSPFTKFSMSLSLVYSYLIVLGLNSVNQKVKFTKITTTSLAILIIVVAIPSFTGHFFSPEMKIKLPTEYLNLFEFLQTQDPTKRLAIFPETNIWGWYTYQWGYQGSGFLWHGISQPIISRSYDVWNRHSQNYYHEITQVLANDNPNLILAVLNKYHVSLILIDSSITNGSAKSRYFQLRSLKELLPSFNLIFQSGNLSLFQTNLDSNYFQGTNIKPENSNPVMNLSEKTEISPKNQTTPEDCNSHAPLTTSNNILSVSNGQTACWGYHFDDISLANGYILETPNQTTSGLPPIITVVDQTKNSNIIESQLNQSAPQQYLIHPRSSNSFGLSVNYQLNSYHQTQSQSHIFPPKLYLLPNYTLPNVIAQYQQTTSPTNPLQTTHSSPWLHIIKSTSDRHLLFFQSYSKGWLAFYFDGLKPTFLTDHTLVNNWANGWQLPSQLEHQRTSEPTIYILFWPQLLQFLGFGLILLTFILILIPHPLFNS